MNHLQEINLIDKGKNNWTFHYIMYVVTFPHCLQRGETLVVVGPDSLIAFGYPGRVLRLQEEYVVGIGGFCSYIAEWSTVASYSSSELNLLRELASGCPGPTKGDCTSNQILETYSLVFIYVHSLPFFSAS